MTAVRCVLCRSPHRLCSRITAFRSPLTVSGVGRILPTSRGCSGIKLRDLLQCLTLTIITAVTDVLIRALPPSLGTPGSSWWSIRLCPPQPSLPPLISPPSTPHVCLLTHWVLASQEESQLRFQRRPVSCEADCLEPVIVTFPFSLAHPNRLVTGVACGAEAADLSKGLRFTEGKLESITQQSL